MERKIYLSKPLAQCCREYCEDKGISFSSWVRSLIMAELSRRGRIVRDGRIKHVVIRDR